MIFTRRSYLRPRHVEREEQPMWDAIEIVLSIAAVAVLLLWIRAMERV